MSFLYNNISHLLVGALVGRTNTKSKSRLKPIPKVNRIMSQHFLFTFAGIPHKFLMVFGRYFAHKSNCEYILIYIF